MKAAQILIASFVLIVLHGLTMLSSCGTMKKHKAETSEEHSSQTVQIDKEAQTIVETLREIQKDWLHELEFSSATITQDTVILSKISTRKTGSKNIRTQEHEESKHLEQKSQEQTKARKSDIRSEKQREPPRVLLLLGLILLIVTGLAWIYRKT